jgi:hypothetical protein
MQKEVLAPITRKQATDLFLNGAPVVIVEYRSGQAEQIQWRDKETGKTLTAVITRHTVEAGTRSIAIAGERTEEGFTVGDFRPVAKKGQMCLWHIASFTQSKGAFSGSGRLQLLVD